MRGFQQLRTTAGSAESAMREAAAEATVALSLPAEEGPTRGRARPNSCRRNSAPVVLDTAAAAAFASSAFGTDWEASWREKDSMNSSFSSEGRWASCTSSHSVHGSEGDKRPIWQSFDVVGEQVGALPSA